MININAGSLKMQHQVLRSQTDGNALTVHARRGGPLRFRRDAVGEQAERCSFGNCALRVSAKGNLENDQEATRSKWKNKARRTETTVSSNGSPGGCTSVSAPWTSGGYGALAKSGPKMTKKNTLNTKLWILPQNMKRLYALPSAGAEGLHIPGAP